MVAYGTYHMLEGCLTYDEVRYRDIEFLGLSYIREVSIIC